MQFLIEWWEALLNKEPQAFVILAVLLAILFSFMVSLCLVK